MKEKDINDVIEEQVDGVNERIISYDASWLQRIWWGSIAPTIRDTFYLVIDNFSLFLGVVLMSSSILNIEYGRYCDGMRSDSYACVNSATVYEYSTSTIILFVIGAVSITLWYVKRNTRSPQDDGYTQSV